MDPQVFWRLPVGDSATRLLSISSFSLQKKRDGHRPEEPRTTSRSTPRVSPPVQAKCRLSPCALRRPLSCPASPPPSLVSIRRAFPISFRYSSPIAALRTVGVTALRPDPTALFKDPSTEWLTRTCLILSIPRLSPGCARQGRRVPPCRAEGRGEWGRPLLSSLAQHRKPGSRDPGPEHRADWNIPLPTSPLRRSSA